MGAGASAAVPGDVKSDIKAQIGVSNDKRWLDAHDISNLTQAKTEIKRLRGLAASALLDPASGAAAGGAARQAVMDRGGPMTGPYVKKTFPKSDAVKAMIQTVMRENVLFKYAKEDEIVELVDAFEPIAATKGEVIITQGSKGENFYVIESGQIDISIVPPGSKDAAKVGSLADGQSFGELALMYNTPRAATCECASDVKLWTIDRLTYRQVQTHFKAARSEKYVKFIAEVEIESGGKKGKLGDCLSKVDLEHMADAMEEETFAAGAVIIRQGEAGDYFYIIESGTVSVHIDKSTKPAAGSRRATDIKSDTKINTLAAGSFFGQKALLSEDTRNASVVAMEPTRCLALGRDDFVSMLGSVSELLEGGGKKEAEAGPVVTRKDEGITLADLNILKTLGHGAFGRVKLVEHKTKGETYALKCQGKKAIVDNCLQDHIMMERQILMVLDHPFILKLYSALQDTKYIYFVLEILLGGELFTWLRKQGRFEEAGSKFYAAQVVLGFQHMHSKKIAYRDLKPENLVLDSQGYLKIVDLGLAKIVDGKTWTLCGTPDYLAPEIILNEGHDKAVDYWALGVLIYELVAGIPPFYADDPMEVYEKILSSNMTFPQHFTKNLCDIVRKLLKLCQSKRLGNGKGGCTGIIKHKWFSGFDWEGLLNYGLSSPITVKVSDSKDASNFDNYEDEDDNSPECLDWEPDLN